MSCTPCPQKALIGRESGAYGAKVPMPGLSPFTGTDVCTVPFSLPKKSGVGL